MKKLTGILLAVCMTASLLIGCGQKAANQSTQTTESQTATVQTEISRESSEEVSDVQHCLLLAGKNGTWLLADRENGTVFTTEVPSDLTDESGKKISAEILKAGDYVDVYGDGIMLESYPGQYPGVNKMVVTGEGTTDELKQYQDVIDMVFAEPDTSETPTAGVVYASSLGQTMGLMTGPMNYTWKAPSGGSEDDTVTACGAAALHGKQAEAFVRYRDTDYHFTALYRMDQQQEYITQYFQAVKAASKTDSQIVVHLFDMIQDYMVTDMTKDQYVKIAMDGMEAGSLTSEDFYTVPGVEEITEKYDVYRADRQAAIQIILDLFYRETE